MWTMTVDSIHDIKVFALSLICGFLSGIILDAFRACRRCFSFGKTMVAIQDIVTCTLIFLMFTHVINKGNDGEVRWFEFAGAVLGAVIYYFSISPWIMKCIISFMNSAKKIYDFFRDKILRVRKKLTGKYDCVKKRLYKISQKCMLKVRFLKKETENLKDK